MSLSRSDQLFMKRQDLTPHLKNIEIAQLTVQENQEEAPIINNGEEGDQDLNNPGFKATPPIIVQVDSNNPLRALPQIEGFQAGSGQNTVPQDQNSPQRKPLNS